MVKLNIVIVNWNAGETLHKCISSIVGSDLEKSKYNIFVVDNQSSDNSIDLISGLSKNLTIIRNSENVGFGMACNQVLENYSSDYFLLLNPDVILNSNTLSESLNYMESHTDVDVMGVKNINLNGATVASCARFPSAGRLTNDILGLSKISPAFFRPGTIMTDWDHLSFREVDHVIGAFMFIRAAILEKSGFFDPDYFLYMEDVDLSFRIKRAGGKIIYNPDISIIHEGGGTTKSIREQSLLYSLQSRMIYCKKYFKKSTVIYLITISLLFEPFLRLLNSVASFNSRDTRAVVRTYKRYFRWVMSDKL